MARIAPRRVTSFSYRMASMSEDDAVVCLSYHSTSPEDADSVMGSLEAQG